MGADWIGRARASGVPSCKNAANAAFMRELGRRKKRGVFVRAGSGAWFVTAGDKAQTGAQRAASPPPLSAADGHNDLIPYPQHRP